MDAMRFNLFTRILIDLPGIPTLYYYETTFLNRRVYVAYLDPHELSEIQARTCFDGMALEAFRKVEAMQLN